MVLAEACYEQTRTFPREEMFGLTSQIRRAAASVAANIAEGHGRETSGSFVQFLRMSQGSLKELETHVILSGRVGILAWDKVDRLLERSDELGKMLRALIRSLQTIRPGREGSDQ
ncbi:four helix bundle protein [Methylobacterium sp. Leaf399]|uniref:four helix bundle protein n=2 Tax=unclassified Methylobacterium TaxID=2615210 RepID=UPI00071326AB|nr:four helix bundle protein [Methylobacterium sp. Leaf399]